jgi:hypothetical protein
MPITELKAIAGGFVGARSPGLVNVSMRTPNSTLVGYESRYS